MKALLAFDILQRHDGKARPHRDTEKLYAWLDRAGYEKCVAETYLNAGGAKVLGRGYVGMPMVALADEVDAVSRRLAVADDDRRATELLNLLYLRQIDVLITEDQNTYLKAQALGIYESVFGISAFLEKCTSEHPEWVDYKVLSVRKMRFGEVDLSDHFFDSLKESYSEFSTWFEKKRNEPAYVSMYNGKVIAFLYLKIEDVGSESYSEFSPQFSPCRRLKIGTFKVDASGFRLGERFLKIVFDNALAFKVDEIYVTIFDRDDDTRRLMQTLQKWGFQEFGTKQSANGIEHVYVRSMQRQYDAACPLSTYPFVSRSAKAYLIPIYPEYHTELLPDSLLKNECADDFVDSEPHRNALSKIYISRSYQRDAKRGDLLLFYRTGGYHASVISTIGIVEEVVTDIVDEADFIKKCRKRSVFTDAELSKHWNWSSSRPFIIKFLYAYTFQHRMTLKDLIEAGVIKDIGSAPRGLVPLTNEQFQAVLAGSKTDPAILAD